MNPLQNGDGGSLSVYGGGHPSDQLPPQNLDAERGLIGSVLLDPGVILDVIDMVAASDFYRAHHQAVWEAILVAVDAEIPVDPILLAERLMSGPGVPGVDWLEFLREIIDATPHAASATEYATVVRHKRIVRDLIAAHNHGLTESYAGLLDAQTMLSHAESRILAIGDPEAQGQTVRVGDVLPSVLDKINRRQMGEVTGIESGLSDLDSVTSGFQPGNLIYVAGRTGMGKTALVVNILDHVTINRNRPVMLASLEMSKDEITERMLVLRSGVDNVKVRDGCVPNHEMPRIASAAARIQNAPLFIDDASDRTVRQIAANARRHKKREGIQLLVVDLINHVKGEDERISRREQIGDMSRRFKALARELSIPVVVVAQLNRGPEQREGNRPRKSDLQECGGLEQDADLVILLYRAAYYDPNEEPGIARIIVDKNRNGPTRDVKVQFEGSLMRFSDLSPIHEAPFQEGAF